MTVARRGSYRCPPLLRALCYGPKFLGGRSSPSLGRPAAHMSAMAAPPGQPSVAKKVCGCCEQRGKCGKPRIDVSWTNTREAVSS